MRQLLLVFTLEPLSYFKLGIQVKFSLPVRRGMEYVANSAVPLKISLAWQVDVRRRKYNKCCYSMPFASENSSDFGVLHEDEREKFE